MSVSHQTYITETNHETNKLYSTVTCNPNTLATAVLIPLFILWMSFLLGH